MVKEHELYIELDELISRYAKLGLAVTTPDAEEEEELWETYKKCKRAIRFACSDTEQRDSIQWIAKFEVTHNRDLVGHFREEVSLFSWLLWHTD
jgi:hypothetical protein